MSVMLELSSAQKTWLAKRVCRAEDAVLSKINSPKTATVKNKFWEDLSAGLRRTFPGQTRTSVQLRQWWRRRVADARALHNAGTANLDASDRIIIAKFKGKEGFRDDVGTELKTELVVEDSDVSPDEPPAKRRRSADSECRELELELLRQKLVHLKEKSAVLGQKSALLAKKSALADAKLRALVARS